MPVLADASAWVEFDRRTGSDLHLRFRALLREGLREIAATEPVLMEVLAGPRTDRGVDRLRHLLRSVTWVPIDLASDFDGAAALYRQCRRNGVTPRGLQDCLIAQIAIRARLPLLARDGDFGQMAEVTPLELA